MNAIFNKTMSFLRNEDGPTATEYAILLSLIIVVAIVSLRAFGVGLSGAFEFINNAIQF